MKLWFWIEELHVIFLKEVSFEGNFILILAKNQHKIEKLLFRIEVLCVLFHKRVLNKISSEFQPKISAKLKNFELEFKCYVSYFSRRYHLNEILYSISSNNKQKLMKLWFWIEELHVIFFKEVTFEWYFIPISAKNKHKIVKFWFGIQVLCVIFLKEVSFEWNFVLNFN